MPGVLESGRLGHKYNEGEARIPSALRSENRSIFGVFLLSTIAILLSIDVTYRAVDAWLGSENYTNLFLRFVVYGTVLRAYAAPLCCVLRWASLSSGSPA